MATATKKAPSSPPPDPRPKAAPAWLRGLDAVYRFLASLKLAVLTLGTLAAVLAYSTFFEKWYGTAAVQEWIYRSRGFAVLLAFLGTNILCAALIRFPWKRRQTGFVITHAGLLVLLGGSWYSLLTSDEGHFAAFEGETKDSIVRTDYPVIRVRQVDPHNPGEALHEWELPFRPGSFAWGPGRPRPGWLTPSDAARADAAPTDVLTRPDDPFQLVVKSHIPSSVPADEYRPDPKGFPAAKVRVTFKAPGMPQARDVFDDESRWFAIDNKLYRVAKDRGSSGPMPAQFAFNFVDRPELVDDFLNPPAKPGHDGAARFRYEDASHKTRTFDWTLDGQEGKSITLPGSDLSVKFLGLESFPAEQAGLGRSLGAAEIALVNFEVRKGDSAPMKHLALANVPMGPNAIPRQSDDPHAAPTPVEPLVRINYDPPPALDPKSNGRFGLVEVLGTQDGSLYYRVWGRGEAGETRGRLRPGKGRLEKGKEVAAFGGNASMPMTIAFRVEDYLTSAVKEKVAKPFPLPPNKLDMAIPASLVAMTVKDPHDPSKETTREFYVRQSGGTDPVWVPVTFGPGDVYEVAYDVDREKLPFELKLVDFQRGFDPGTQQASRFSSDVLLTDKALGVENKPFHISMNEPLTHRGYTFYQQSYRIDDRTGKVMSTLQVGSNPGRRVMYGGCLLVVLGAFVQFYMRAGVFTDGGKRERDRAASKARQKAGLPAEPSAAATEPAGQVSEDDIL
jgi:hypothetical protein